MVTSRRNRGQIRRSVGMATNALNMDGGSETLAVTANSSTSNWTVGALAFGSSGEHKGKWALATEGSSNASSNVGLVRRVQTSTSSNTNLQFLTAWPASADTSQRFELWDESIPPLLLNDYINQAISEAVRKAARPVESLALHTGGGIRAFNMPDASSFIGLYDGGVEYRESWTGEQLTSFDTTMSSAANVTAVTDTSDLREGSAAAKVTIAAAFSSAAEAATSCFGAVDMGGYTHLEFWAKSNITTTSSSLQVRLGEGSTARETLTVPAMGSDSWNYHRVALSNPEVDTSITRFILMSGASDAGSATVWLDDASGVSNATEAWSRIHPKFWGLGRQNKQLVLERDASVPYALLRVRGVRAPNLLTTDSAVSEVNPDYIINSVTAKLLRSRSDYFAANPDAGAENAANYESLAQLHYTRIQQPQGVRWFADS